MTQIRMLVIFGRERELSNERRGIKLRGFRKGVWGSISVAGLQLAKLVIKLLGDFRRKTP